MLKFGGACEPHFQRPGAQKPRQADELSATLPYAYAYRAKVNGHRHAVQIQLDETQVLYTAKKLHS